MNALELFGDRGSLMKAIATRIREARIHSGMDAEELGRLANWKQPSDIAAFENGELDASEINVSDFMTVVTQLGISIERLLPFNRSLSGAEKITWLGHCDAAAAKPVAAGNGVLTITQDARVELFVRINALQELFTAPEYSCLPA